jgi:hypothetical protein
MNFGQALEVLRTGNRITRQGWNGKGMFIFLVPSEQRKVSRLPLVRVYPRGTEILHRQHILMKTAQGDIVPWVCSQSDMLSEDWDIVPGCQVVTIPPADLQ